MEVTWAPSDSPSYRAFFDAARHGTVEQMRAALTSEIDINALEGDGFEGMAALHLACFHNGDVEVVRFLLDHGAEVNILDRDRAGNSYPLHWAANKDRADIVRLLLERGAEKSRKGFDGRNALGMVLYYSLSPRKVQPKQMETIQVLLDHGFSVDESGMVCLNNHATRSLLLALKHTHTLSLFLFFSLFTPFSLPSLHIFPNEP